MATIRLIPSTYSLSNTQYLSVSSASNMYANTDSTTYATVTNSLSGTTSYYIYIKGFNFDDIPSNAVVSSFTVKLRARESGGNTSTSYSPKLCNNTSLLTSTCSPLSTTATTYTFTDVDADWEDIVDYGSDFGIRINCRRASRNTTAYIYIYGAEIEVTYTVPNPRTITSTLTGNGTISPSGAQTYYDSDSYTLTITPTTKTDSVTVTNNGVDVTSLLTPHYLAGASLSTSAVLGTYSLVSGGFSGSGATYFQGLVGKGHTATTTSSNYYSSGSGTQAVFQYAISFSNIPSNATITRLYMMASGHAESTSQSSEYMCVLLKSGSTNLSELYNFKSAGTSNSTQTIEANVLPTVSQLSSLVVECTLGYYGGAINGVTVYLEYATASADIDYYTYTYTVNGNATIAVTIGEEGEKLHLKLIESWREISKIYKKVNGAWTEVALNTLTDPNVYVYKGGVDYNLSNIVVNLDGITSYALRAADLTEGYEGSYEYPISSSIVMREIDVVADGNSFEFNGTTSWMRPSASATFDNFLYNTHTIECYYMPYNYGENGNAQMLFVGRNQKLTIALYCYYYNNLMNFIRSSGVSTKILSIDAPALNLKHYIAANNNGWFFDGVYYPDSESSASTNSVATNDIVNVSGQYTCASVGMRFKTDKTPDCFTGKIYAMRIHSTILSENQLLLNMMCDIGRF